MDASKNVLSLDVLHQRELAELNRKFCLIKELTYIEGFVKAWIREIQAGKTGREAFHYLNDSWTAVMGRERFSDYKSFEVSKKRYLKKPNL